MPNDQFPPEQRRQQAEDVRREAERDRRLAESARAEAEEFRRLAEEVFDVLRRRRHAVRLSVPRGGGYGGRGAAAVR